MEKRKQKNTWKELTFQVETTKLKCNRISTQKPSAAQCRINEIEWIQKSRKSNDNWLESKF